MVEILNDNMAAAGASRHWLAQQVEGRVSRSQLYDILAGKRMMDIAEFLAICEALELRPSEVFARAGQGPQAPQDAADAG